MHLIGGIIDYMKKNISLHGDIIVTIIILFILIKNTIGGKSVWGLNPVIWIILLVIVFTINLVYYKKKKH